jgi:hypothetical protein
LRRDETAVYFWDVTSGDMHAKYVSNFKDIKAYGDFCCLVLANEDYHALPKTTGEQ